MLRFTPDSAEFVAAREELIKKRLGALFWSITHKNAEADQLGNEIAAAA